MIGAAVCGSHEDGSHVILDYINFIFLLTTDQIGDHFNRYGSLFLASYFVDNSQNKQSKMNL